MAEGEFFKDLTDVVVTFNDQDANGQFRTKTYRITAGIHIGTYLARESAETGILVLFNDDESHGIPTANIREYALKPVPVE